MTSVSDSGCALRWTASLFGASLATAAAAAPGDDVAAVRELSGRIGPVTGSTLACRDIARSRIQIIADKFQTVIQQTSSNEAERDDLTRMLDRYVAYGRGAVASGKLDCKTADRQLAQIERSFSGQSPVPDGPPRNPPPSLPEDQNGLECVCFKSDVTAMV